MTLEAKGREHEARDALLRELKEAMREESHSEREAIAAYRAWLSATDADQTRPRFDDGPGFENLQQLTEWCFELTRKAPDELTQARRFVAWRDGLSFDETQARYVPAAEHWLIALDHHWVVPLGQPSAVLDDYAHRWREAHHNFRGAEMVVFLPPGEALQFAVWSVKAIGREAVQSYLDALSGHAGEPRYTSVAYPWDPLGVERVYLPPAFEAPTSFRTMRADAQTQALVLLDTGIGALNKQFRGGAGLPLGARVVIGGLTGQGKTTLGLHLAEAACAQGWFVVWLAYDESCDEIQVRRLQRRGLAPEVAQTLPLAAMAALDALDFFVVPAGAPFEELARDAHGEANGCPVLFVVDSIQKLETRAGEGKGERERITAAVDAIQASQAKYPSTIVMTAEIARGSGATKGSGAIDYGATLALRVRRSGSVLAVDVVKNRHGSEHAFALHVDFEQQLLSAPAQSAPATPATLQRIKDELVAAAGAKPRTRSALANLVRGNTDAVRAAVAELVDAGELVSDGKHLRPRPPADQ